MIKKRLRSYCIFWERLGLEGTYNLSNFFIWINLIPITLLSKKEKNIGELGFLGMVRHQKGLTIIVEKTTNADLDPGSMCTLL